MHPPSLISTHSLLQSGGEQNFNLEKNISKLTNKQTKYFNRILAVRNNARDIGDEVFNLRSDSHQNTKIKQKMASVPKFNIDTRFLGTEEEWMKISPTISYFVKQWCPRYSDYVVPLENGHFLLKTSDVRVHLSVTQLIYVSTGTGTCFQNSSFPS